MVKYNTTTTLRKGGGGMKRLVVFLTLCLLLAGVFCLPVSAETAATQVDLQCTITAEGDCLVTATVNLRL